MHDVVVVGAGPVGATFALALRHADLDIVVLDARAAGEATRADRSLALSHGARLILERLGAWSPLAGTAGAVTPIVTIDISQARGFGGVELTASEQDLPALGYVVSYRALQSALDAALARSGIDVRFGHEARAVSGAVARVSVELASASREPLDARLAVVADGAAAAVRGIARRRHEYGQTAIVGEVALDHPHRGIAYERFTAEGPVALLPERDHYALVWTQVPAAAARALALSDAEFLAALSSHFGSRVRGFAGVRARRAFPLTLEVARDTTAARVAVIGNAAQALHPVAGQGFNLGLRDAFELATLVRDTPRDVLGSPAMLARYRAARRLDRRAGIASTHGLTQLFASDAPAVRIPRGLGMMLLDSVPVAKRAFTRAMLYGPRW